MKARGKPQASHWRRSKEGISVRGAHQLLDLLLYVAVDFAEFNPPQGENPAVDWWAICESWRAESKQRVVGCLSIWGNPKHSWYHGELRGGWAGGAGQSSKLIIAKDAHTSSGGWLAQPCRAALLARDFPRVTFDLYILQSDTQLIVTYHVYYIQSSIKSKGKLLLYIFL